MAINAPTSHEIKIPYALLPLTLKTDIFLKNTPTPIILPIIIKVAENVLKCLEFVGVPS
jgi:hypothetical protein